MHFLGSEEVESVGRGGGGDFAAALADGNLPRKRAGYPRLEARQGGTRRIQSAQAGIALDEIWKRGDVELMVAARDESLLGCLEQSDRCVGFHMEMQPTQCALRTL